MTIGEAEALINTKTRNMAAAGGGFSHGNGRLPPSAGGSAGARVTTACSAKAVASPEHNPGRTKPRHDLLWSLHYGTGSPDGKVSDRK
jgi:hypothetical protein